MRSLPVRFPASVLLFTFTFTLIFEGKSFAVPPGGPSGAGAAGAPAGKILEAFHSDLSTGRAVFSLPLAVPPGRRGLQPNVSLDYSSSGRNGPLGVGWALEFGSIERSTRFGLPQFNSSDLFTLRYGGVSADLVEVAPGEYRLKEEQLFAKILFNGTRWTVTSKDGTTATFGGTGDSIQTVPAGTLAWFLNEVRDIHGNVMTITYTSSGRQAYPASIRYTSHPATGLASIHEVRFTWASRPDVSWDERFGDRIETAQRLSVVEAFTQGNLVRKYQLAYQASPLNGRSMLSSVTTIGSDGTTSLPPVVMRYSNSWGGWNRRTDWRVLNPDGPILLHFADNRGKDTGMRLEDVTGDGRPDVLQGRDGIRRAFINSPDGWIADSPSTSMWVPPYPFVHWIDDDAFEDAGARFADLNGDGRLDLMYAHRTRLPSANYLNTGNGWQETTQWDMRSAVVDFPYFVQGGGRDTGLRLVDLNGDGKTDLLQGHGPNSWIHAYLNTGSGWRMDDRWAPPVSFVNDSSVDIGCRLADLNGDGLIDLFYATPGGVRAAYLNTGRGWRRETTWNSGPFQGQYFADSSGQDQGWRLMDVNGDGLVDIVRHMVGDPGRYVLLNTGTGWTTAGAMRFLPERPMDRGGVDIGVRTADINGDGLTDLVYGLTVEPEFADLWTSTAGTLPATPPDLLTRVENGLGGATTLAYRPSTAYDNTGGDVTQDLPFVMPTVASQTLDNGMGWTTTTQFTYAWGNYNAPEREFLGFAWAKTTDPVRTTSQTWFSQSIHSKGQPRMQEVRDSANRLFSRSENTWSCRHDLYGGRVHFCFLADTTATVFDGDATSKQTKVEFAYDDYGNLIRKVELGNTAVTGDERTTTLTYAYNPSLWLMAFPSTTVTRDSANNKLAESWVYYDGRATHGEPPTRGLPTKQEAWLQNPITQEERRVAGAATYDAYGNPLTSTNPLNYTTATVYDETTKTFPVRVTNHLNHVLETTTDLATGQVLSTTDPNRQVTQNRYDPLGRLTKVIGPEDTDTEPGVRYEYDLTRLPTRVTKQVKASASPVAYYTTHSFADGMGRGIQTRSPAQDPNQQIVSGCPEFGPRGEVTAQYLAYFSPNSTAYSAPPAATPKARYDYDPVGRVTRTTEPDDAVTTTAYDDWTVSVTNANRQTFTRTSDAYGRLVEVLEPPTSDHGAATTRYAYDPAGRLTAVTDARGNATRITYDSWGRKLRMDDFDMGRWEYNYDDAGNLLRQTDAKGQILEFTYDPLNRLTQKRGKPNAQDPWRTLATYSYDVTAQPNRVGRLAIVTDPSGSTEFFYDRLGRETRTTKTIFGVPYTVERTYDPLNRVTQLTYPDTTLVRNEYSPQGIRRITFSLDGGATFSNLLASANYNAANETLALAFGNGATTTFAYDPRTLRIDSIRTTDSRSQTLQDFSYAFDPVGNLQTLTDRSYSASQSFQYDAVNRLKVASGAYGGFSYRYDALGNVLEKDNGLLLNYNHPTKPHAVTESRAVGQDPLNLLYDANGNLSHKGETEFTYDLENRLVQAVVPKDDAALQTTFLYDGDGGRVRMTVDDGASAQTTTFVGGLYEIHPEETTKVHFFFGPTRLATLTRAPRIIAAPADAMLIGRADESPFPLSFSKGKRFYAAARKAFKAVEEFFVGTAYASSLTGTALHYYHGDHLGSVNLVTDHGSRKVELAEHTPFGSLSRLERTKGAPKDQPFHFTGKRLDDSTGLYYFGARYYDPEIGRFIQPDTIVQAPSDPQTLNRYTYCRNNPLIYTDPTGHSFWKKVGKFFSNLAKGIAKNPWAFIAGIAVGAITAFAIGPMIAGLHSAMLASGSGVTFWEGFILGGLELGIPAFTGSLAGNLASGQKFGTALKNAAIVGATTFVTAGLIEGAYTKGWQSKIHFADTQTSNRLYGEAKKALENHNFQRYIDASRQLLAMDLKPPSAVLWGKSPMSSLGIPKHSYLVAARDAEVKAMGYGPVPGFEAAARLNTAVPGMARAETAGVLAMSEFEIKTWDALLVNAVWNNMDKISMPLYMFTDKTRNCYGWTNTVLTKSGLPPIDARDVW